MKNGRRVLIVCPQCDADDVGENLCGFEWVSRIARRADVTVLTQRFPGHRSPSEQLPGVHVVEWNAAPYIARYPRFNSAVKPWYPFFYLRARAWIREALARGEQFDLMHQIMPMATRYPSPCTGFGIPFVLGPVGGGVATPPELASELDTEPGFMRLRGIDGFRLRHDPVLRRTYSEAASIICCSGYVVERLAMLPLKRVDLEYEVGIETLGNARAERTSTGDEFRLLHVGRTIRTKGLRDTIRALAHLRDIPGVVLDVAGSGEDMPACQREAEELGVVDRIRFHGRVPRSALEPLYRAADLFVFPSFREPTGGVLFECMRHGLPAVVASTGGPGHIVTDACGVRVDPAEPKAYAKAIADAIRFVAQDPVRRNAMGLAARARIAELGLWDRKIERLLAIYEACAVQVPTRAAGFGAPPIRVLETA